MDDAALIASPPTAPTMPATPPAAAARAAVAQRNNRLVTVLALVAVGMFGFGFLLVRLYGIICEATGVNAAPNNAEVASAAPVHTGRMLEVFFESKVFDNLPVRFFAGETVQKVEVGIDAQNAYYFRNLSDRPVRFRPIHQVSPTQVGKHFGMKVCFCFNDQTLGPGEEKEFPVVYTFSPELDARISEVTICYSLLALVDGESKEGSDARARELTAGQGAIVTPSVAPAAAPDPAAP